jgi:lipoprotein-anchoring transpeptidase ErfK/SrfK
VSTHRRETRPRYGRIAVLSTSLTVTVVAALAGLGFIASGSATAGVKADSAAFTSSSTTSTPDPSAPASAATTPTTPTTTGVTTPESAGSSAGTADVAVPASSGTGRRIVFSEGQQRVWLLDANDVVKRTYLVSGSVTDNLQPGTYSVYSRSRWAVGVDESGVMQYFVRFTQGPTGAAIGFHSIPTRNGVPLQTAAQLGTPQSHGCIRQSTPDAVALWNFAPDGTKVVVVA